MTLTDDGNSYMVTMIDKFSRYPMVIPVPNILAITIARCIMKWISYFGPPTNIVSDNGKQFIGIVFNTLCQFLGIRHSTTSAYHPQSNGAIERFHRWLKQRLKILLHNNSKYGILENINWDEFIDLLLYIYRRTPTRTTTKSPASIVLGYNLKSPSQWNLTEVFQEAIDQGPYQDWNSYITNLRELVKLDAQISQGKYNKQREKSEQKKALVDQIAYEIDDMVFYDITSKWTSKSKSLKEPRHAGPYRIVGRSSNKLNYNLFDINNTDQPTLINIPYDKLRPYKHKDSKSQKEKRDEKIQQKVNEMKENDEKMEIEDETNKQLDNILETEKVLTINDIPSAFWNFVEKLPKEEAQEYINAFKKKVNNIISNL